MSWLYFALIAPVLYSVVNLIDDSLLKFVFKRPHFGAMIGGLFGFLPLLSLFFIHMSHIPTNLAVYSLISGCLLTFFYYFYFAALSTSTPSVVVALISTLPPATLIFLSRYILNERLVALQIVGFVIVLVASLLMTLDVKELRRFKASKTIVAILAAVVITDVISLLMKHTYEHVAFYPAYIFYTLGVGIGGLIFLGNAAASGKLAGDLKVLKKVFGRALIFMLLAEGLNILAELFINVAISRGPVSLVRVFEATQPAFVLIIAVVLYRYIPKYFREAKESGLVKRFGYIALGIVGIVLIAVKS